MPSSSFLLYSIFSQHHKQLGTTHREEQIETFPGCLFTAVLGVLLWSRLYCCLSLFHASLSFFNSFSHFLPPFFICLCSILSCVPFCFNKKSSYLLLLLISKSPVALFPAEGFSQNLPWWREGPQQLLLPLNSGHSNSCAVLTWSFQTILNLAYLSGEKIYRVWWTIALQYFSFTAN